MWTLIMLSFSIAGTSLPVSDVTALNVYQHRSQCLQEKSRADASWSGHPATGNVHIDSGEGWKTQTKFECLATPINVEASVHDDRMYMEIQIK